MYKMAAKICLPFLILSVILFQGIIASLTDDDTRESSDFLVRKRRVINHLPGGLTPTPLENTNYLVTMKEHNRAHCSGAILSRRTVITAAPCVRFDIEDYLVFSGSAYAQRMASHNVTSKIVYYGAPPINQQYEGIALITIDPPFVYKRTVGNIELYVGPLPTGTEVTVSGWGYNYPLRPGPPAQRRLRTITLPIIDHEECQNLYRGRFPITEKHLCTYHTEQYCATSDVGVPLVVNDKLVGIFFWKGECSGQRNPDVFINVKRDDYSAWIRQHITP